MAFVFAQSATYSWPVSFELPIDGGRFRRVSFEVLFNRLSQERIEEILLAQQQIQRLVEQGGEDVLERLAESRAHAAEVMAGWVGVKEQDDDPEDLAFTKSNVAKFLSVPGIATAVLTAYGESLKIGKEKN